MARASERPSWISPVVTRPACRGGTSALAISKQSEHNRRDEQHRRCADDPSHHSTPIVSLAIPAIGAEVEVYGGAGLEQHDFGRLHVGRVDRDIISHHRPAR